MTDWTHALRALLVCGAFLLAAVPALADDTEQPAGFDMAAMEEAWNEARTPGEPHKFLARLEGDWNFKNTMWMDPSAPPMESQGESKKTMILGGRYLQEESSGEMMGEMFHGQGVTGYDNTTEKFVSTWIDNMATGILVSHGQRDGDSLTLHGEMKDPMSGQMMKLRMVTRIVDQDHHVFEYFMSIGDSPEMKQMVIEYERKGAE